MRARLLLVVLVALLAVLAPATASAYDECRGLQECVSVVGPWVVVPVGADGGLSTVAWELRCPLRGYVVGGTDARVTTRAVEVTVRGEKGSPVAPGVTTRRSIVFTAQRVGGGAAAAFVPAIGCLPTNGGGGRSQTSTAARADAVQPGTLVRRVAVGRLRRGATTTVVARCPAGARVVEARHAVGFRSAAPPTATQLRSVSTRSAQAGSAARVSGTLGAGAGSARVLLQVHVLCARGTG